MAPGCRTIFMLMSADREYSFENTVHFSWGSLSTLHVTVSQLKEMIRLLPSNPLWGDLCVTVGNLTICLFCVLWRHFNNISNVLWTNIGWFLSLPWTDVFGTSILLYLSLLCKLTISSQLPLMKYTYSGSPKKPKWPKIQFLNACDSGEIVD